MLINYLCHSLHEGVCNPTVSPSDQQECCNRINSLRTNSLCYTCSGRSEYFFNEGRALMSMQDCRKTISVCGSTWRAMVNLVDATATISRFYEQFKAQLSINSQDAPDKQFIVELEEWLQKTEVRPFLDRCSKSAESCPVADSKAICENLISLERSSFIEKSAVITKDRK